MAAPDQHKNLKGAGIAFLGAGMAFFAVTLALGQSAFMGVGAAYVMAAPDPVQAAEELAKLLET